MHISLFFRFQLYQKINFFHGNISLFFRFQVYQKQVMLAVRSGRVRSLNDQSLNGQSLKVQSLNDQSLQDLNTETEARPSERTDQQQGPLKRFLRILCVNFLLLGEKSPSFISHTSGKIVRHKKLTRNYLVFKLKGLKVTLNYVTHLHFIQPWWLSGIMNSKFK